MPCLLGQFEFTKEDYFECKLRITTLEATYTQTSQC